MDTGATTSTAIPQVYYNNAGTPTNDAVSNHNHSSSPISSVIITIIILSSIIIISAIVYFLIRFFSSRTTVSPVSEHENENEDAHHQVQIALDNKDLNWLPVFTYSSITGNKLSGGDCAVCLTKFEAKDRLRRLPLCCHAFHVECIDPWLKSNHTCPLCRSSINPTEADIMKKTGYNGNNNNNNSLRIEIGTISRRRDPSESESDRTSYSLGSYDYVIDDGYEIPVESAHRRDVSGDKDEPAVDIAGDGGNRNWLRDYVDRLSSRTMSFGGSGRFFTGSSRRSEVVDDYEVAHGRIGEEISEYFRWLSGV